MDTGAPADFEHHYEGEHLRNWFRITAVKAGDGLVSTVEDITGRKRLEAEMRQLKLSRQGQLLHAILDAQEAERERLSQSLHNGVGQILFAAKLYLDRVIAEREPSGPGGTGSEALLTTAQLLTEAIRETRRVSYELVPVLLKEYGLEAAVADWCKQFAEGPVHLHCRVEGITGRPGTHLLPSACPIRRVHYEAGNWPGKSAGFEEC